MIIDHNIDDIVKRLENRQIHIELTKAAKELIMSRAYNVQYGARPVKRFLQKYIETEFGRMLLKGEILDRDTVIVSVENGELKLRVE